MKTLKQTNKMNIAGNILVAMMVMISMNTFADGNKDSCAKTSAKSDSSEILEMESVSVNSTLKSPAALIMPWMIEEAEAELEVADLEETSNMLPAWIMEAKDAELDVQDYIPTEEVVPYWMIVEEEPELEVTDLVIN